MSLNFQIIGDKELVAYLNGIDKNIKPQIKSGLSDIGTHLKREVKNKFGVYQKTWPKLKRASVIAKYRRRTLAGFKTKKGKGSSIGSDDPLFLFGNLKNSIQKELSGLEVTIYSDNEYSAVHEYGYKHVPARSYMRLTLDEETENVVKIMDSKIGKLI
jgi:phage gpG-like protein